jgi:hypothetical protein
VTVADRLEEVFPAVVPADEDGGDIWDDASDPDVVAPAGVGTTATVFGLWLDPPQAQTPIAAAARIRLSARGMPSSSFVGLWDPRRKL